MKWYWWVLIAVLVIGAGVVTYKVIQKRKEVRGVAEQDLSAAPTLERPTTETATATVQPTTVDSSK